MSNINATTATTPEELMQRAQEYYEKELRSKLEKKYLGKFVAIEIESKQYFIGGTLEEALEKAKKEFPYKVFHSIKIGSPGVFKTSSIVDSDAYQWFAHR